MLTPDELEAVNRLRERLEWGQDVATDEELLDTLAGQRELLQVQLDQLWHSVRVQLAELAHRLLTWRGWWRW